ncbi:MAG: hypothetical protein EOS85_03400 [Mesorhizobium sp.]|nr:MAG: hypothetical protein EOS85_03400 [Mesorhizobium sp.]
MTGRRELAATLASPSPRPSRGEGEGEGLLGVAHCGANEAHSDPRRNYRSPATGGKAGRAH